MKSTASKKLLCWYLAAMGTTVLARINVFGNVLDFVDTSERLMVFLRGIGSDALVSSGMAVCGVYLVHWKWAKGLLVFIWSYLLAGNTVHIRFNYANLDVNFLQYGMHHNFLLGSALHPNILYLTALFVVFFYVSYKFYARILRDSDAVARWARGAVIIVIFVFIPYFPLYPGWIQYNVIEENITNQIVPFFNESQDGASIKASVFSKEENRYFAPEHFTSDLGGRKWIHPSGKNPNILVIVVEALSAHHLDMGYLPNLRKVAASNLFYPYFFSLQRITTNGLYALWCGDYPNLISMDTKSEVLIRNGFDRQCLPHILSENGYSTVFMQSADTGFMNKDELGKAVGIMEIKGGMDLPVSSTNNRWGVDDTDLYASALQKVDELTDGLRPFFLTLLTIGTHHPYPGVPEEIVDQFDSTEEAAFQYTDQLISEFLATLKQRGQLDNTLVVITSDESGVKLHPQRIPEGLLKGNQGIMILQEPSGRKATISGIFSQKDFAVSILDYLNLSIPEEIQGRSLFREYDDFSPVLFSNIFQRRVYALVSEEQLISCDYTFSSCFNHFFESEMLFNASHFDSEKLEDIDEGFLRATIDASDRSYDDGKHTVIFEKSNSTASEADLYIYHNRQFEVRQGEEGIWKIQATADSNNTAPIHIVFNVIQLEKGETILANDFKHDPEKRVEEMISLSPSQKLEFFLSIPYQGVNNTVFYTSLYVYIEENDALNFQHVSIEKKPSSQGNPIKRLKITTQ